MSWPDTPHRSAPHLPAHRKPTSLCLTCIVAAIVVIMLVAVVQWYVQ